jgi:hypothetical protein
LPFVVQGTELAEDAHEAASTTRGGGPGLSPRRLVMSSEGKAEHALEDPLAELERQLIHAYLAGAGQEFHTLVARTDDDARQLLAEASRYASSKLSEIDARLHYLRGLHGQPG